ncbi:DNA-directed RNA polymerase subunit beta [Pelomyxa schiedti]|nr:DNA-directed RNA polymerase subunit beta [Pelomyxa schiedti]
MASYNAVVTSNLDQDPTPVVLVNNRVRIECDTSTTISSDDIAGMLVGVPLNDTSQLGVTFAVENMVGGYFSLWVEDSYVNVTSFTQGDIVAGNVLFTQNDLDLPPAFAIRVGCQDCDNNAAYTAPIAQWCLVAMQCESVVSGNLHYIDSAYGYSLYGSCATVYLDDTLLIAYEYQLQNNSWAYWRLLDTATGAPISPLVPVALAVNKHCVTVAGLPNDTFAVTWLQKAGGLTQDTLEDNWLVYSQVPRLDDGEMLAVKISSAPADSQHATVLYGDINDQGQTYGVAIVWTDVGTMQIHIRSISVSTGFTLTDEEILPTGIEPNTQAVLRTSVASLPGAFVVVYIQDEKNVMAIICYSENLTLCGTPLLVSDNWACVNGFDITECPYQPHVSALQCQEEPAYGFVVSWQSLENVYVRTYSYTYGSFSAYPTSDPLRVNSQTWCPAVDSEDTPKVSMAGCDFFVVTYSAHYCGGVPGGSVLMTNLLGQLFNIGTGVKWRNEFIIWGSSERGYPGAMAENSFTIFWTSIVDGTYYVLLREYTIETLWSPVIVNNALNISQDETFNLTSLNLAAIDFDSSNASLRFNITSVVNGEFLINTRQVTTFEQSQINNVVFKHTGGSNAPKYSISVTDGQTMTPPIPCTVTFTKKRPNVILWSVICSVSLIIAAVGVSILLVRQHKKRKSHTSNHRELSEEDLLKVSYPCPPALLDISHEDTLAYNTRKDYLEGSSFSKDQLGIFRAFIIPLSCLPKQGFQCNLSVGTFLSEQFSSCTFFVGVTVVCLEMGLMTHKDGITVTVIPITGKARIINFHLPDGKGDGVVLSVPESGCAYLFSESTVISIARLSQALEIAVASQDVSSHLHALVTDLIDKDCMIPSDAITCNFQVARGGFGEVWKGTLGAKAVALKKLREEKIIEAELRIEFVREMMLLHELRGTPYVLDFLGLHVKSGELWMVTEWCSQGGLECIIFSESYMEEFSADSKRLLMRNICLGMQAIHEKKIIHRDLKPENVLVVNKATWDIRIADLGLARISLTPGESLTRGVEGSSWYSAPELFTGHHDFLVDVFSWGIMAWEIMCGLRLADEISREYRMHPYMWKVQLQEIVHMDDTWPSTLCHLMRRCWAIEKVSDRPSFTEWAEFLSKPWL